MKKLVAGMTALCASTLAQEPAEPQAPNAGGSLKIYGVADISLARYRTSGAGILLATESKADSDAKNYGIGDTYDVSRRLMLMAAATIFRRTAPRATRCSRARARALASRSRP